MSVDIEILNIINNDPSSKKIVKAIKEVAIEERWSKEEWDDFRNKILPALISRNEEAMRLFIKANNELLG
jgi:hypothetical protein